MFFSCVIYKNIINMLCTAYMCCVCAKSLQSCLTLCDPRDCSLQAPLSMGFFRQEHWSGLASSPPGHLPDSGIKPTSLTSPASEVGSAPPAPLGEPTARGASEPFAMMWARKQFWEHPGRLSCTLPRLRQRKLCRKWRFLEAMVSQPEALPREPGALCWGVLNASAGLSVTAVRTIKTFPHHVFCFHVCSPPPGSLLRARLAFPAGSTVQSSLRLLVPNSASWLISSPTSSRGKWSF